MIKHITYVSSCIKFVSTAGPLSGTDAAAAPVKAAAPAVSPFSFVEATDSDLWDPEDEEGRSGSGSGLGCIKVNGSSATSSLKHENRCSQLEMF